MTEAIPRLPVLVVDDSPFSRKLLEHAISKDPHSRLFAENGNEALQLFKEHRAAIVITDWMLPDSSGPELCKKIRVESSGSYTYIILLTSMTEKKDIVQGLSSGADDYLTKPFDRGELLARIGVGRRTIDLHREIDAKNKQLEELAHTDPLTGLPNRRAIEEWASRQLRGAARHGFPLWVIHMDLDCFKNINDTYGHGAGDQVLRRVAAILKEHTRASDISGRMGGDEFLLVITHVEEKYVPLALERLRAQILLQQFSFGGKTFSITASIGVSGFAGKQSPELAHVVQQADKALNCAEGAGRNQIKIESLSVPSA